MPRTVPGSRFNSLLFCKRYLGLEVQLGTSPSVPTQVAEEGQALAIDPEIAIVLDYRLHQLEASDEFRDPVASAILCGCPLCDFAMYNVL